MTTAIAQPAKREHTEQEAAALAQAAIARAQAKAAGLAEQVTSKADAAAMQSVLAQKIPGLDAQDFVRDNRIQVKHGSLFVDPYLVLHPRELAPANEAKLREKLRLTFTVNNPSFYESYERLMIALNLGQLVPVAMQARESRLIEEQKKLEAEKNGGESQLKKLFEARQHPFATMVRETIEKPTTDPVGMEALKNGLTIYMLMREKLTQRGYLEKLSDYVPRFRTPDQVLGELADKAGVTPLQVREAALKGGIDGVGQLLGLDPTYVADAKKMVAYAATQDFGFNVIEHWHLGRQLLGVPAPMEQKIAHGLEARITGSIAKFRAQVKHHFEVPEGVKVEEKRIAESLNLLEPIQRALMHKLGYEICYTPEFLADDIAMYRGVYGLHRKAASDLRDTRGTYRIYFSSRNDLKGSMRTLVHEVAHNLWPEQFAPEDVKTMDAALASDAKRFLALHRLLNEKFSEFDKFLRAYQAGSDAEKAAIVQTTKAYFASYGVSIDEGVLPYLRDANEFRYLVAYAVDRLRIEGDFYAKSGYDSPSERNREIISRFAELKQVELSGEQGARLLQFLAPGLNGVWENHYIPHLKRVYQKLLANEQVASQTVGNMPKVEQRPEEPKVEQRPVATTTRASACVAPVDTPGTRVESATLDPAAMSVLGAMNIHPMR